MAIKSEQLNVDEKKLKRVNKYTAELLENLNQIAAIDFFNVSFKNLEEAVAKCSVYARYRGLNTLSCI